MGTRSVTIIMSDTHEGHEGEEKELCRIYRQFDGYPEGHGIELAELCDRMITNGISGSVFKLDKNGMPVKDEDDYTSSNGMGELAAQVVMGLKNESAVGNIYLEPPFGEINDWAEYVYIVRGKEGEKPIIECHTQTGPRPFNIQSEAGLVFKGTALEWIEESKSEKGFGRDDE